MSTDASGNGFDATVREFASGQKLFNRYTLKKTLGRGGMGIVWLARDEELERDVALKFLPELIIHDRAVLGDLKRETRRSLELTHKNIVRIYDFIHDETSGCISMEYIDGDTLSNLRADKPHKVFETSELTDWVSELCDALDYAHNHARIVHRDLKPTNLMVNQRGDLKVADFGIARSLSDSMSMLTMDRGKSGTLLYMSPQQLDGERGNHLDDVYSLGASVYELLTSKPPFYSGNVDRQIREKMPPPMTQRRKELEIEGEPIDAAWEEVVRACLAKNPDRRPQSVAEIAKRLEVPSPKTRRAQRAAGKQSNKRVGLLLAIGVLIGIAAISGWYFGFYRPMRDRQSRFGAPVVSQPSRTEATAPPLASIAPSRSEANEIPDGSILGITEAKVSETPDPEAETKILLRIRIKKIPNVVFDHTKAKIQVFFYDAVDDRDIKLTDADVNYQWLTPHDWQEANPAILDISYVRPKTGTSSKSHRKYLGYIARVYYDDKLQDTRAEPPKLLSLFPAPSQLTNTVAERPSAPAGPRIVQDAVYEGTIHVRNDSFTSVPLAITIGSDPKSGTMTQSSRRGDTVVKFTGVWDGQTLRAVTDQVISAPKGVHWEPESFALRFSDDGKSATYECIADGKTYVADLSAQTAPAVKTASVYKGIIDRFMSSAVPLTINLAADRKSGTMTQTSKSGDTVVRFTGIWDGTTLHAVTDEVISKPKNIQWKPESFTLHFADDGKRGSYECNSEGRLYSAELSPP